MVPIHDTDVAEERWSRAEWQNYELWERIEFRLKRQKRFWVIATVAAFIVFSAVPITTERWPKWATRSIARRLAQEINRVKYEAIADRAAYRVRFIEEGRLSFIVERLANCAAVSGEKMRSSTLVDEFFGEKYAWISSAAGMALEVPGLVNEFCYDSLAGNAAFVQGQSIVGFGIISVKDLAEKRLDRLSVLLLSGPSAEISFD